MGVTRRSAVVGLGSVAALTAFKGCGGGGGGSSGGGGGGPTGLPGSFWYEKADGNLYVVAGGTATPVVVNKVLGDPASSNERFSVSRNSPRYLSIGHSGIGPDVQAVINCYEQANNGAYCHVNLAGYASAATVSPSGKYIVALRSPELAYSTFNLGRSTAIIDLIIVDISNVSNIHDIRNTRTEGQSAIYGLQWLDSDDRFVYMTWGDGNFGDSMYAGSVAGGSQGDQFLGKIDKQGLRVGSFSVHPDGSSMLVDLFSDDYILGVWDVYLYKTNGQAVDRMTATGKGYSGIWSPDGNSFFFKYGTSNGCAGVGCSITCSAHYAPSTMRSATLPMVQTLDNDKVPCLYGTSWRQ